MHMSFHSHTQIADLLDDLSVTASYLNALIVQLLILQNNSEFTNIFDPFSHHLKQHCHPNVLFAFGNLANYIEILTVKTK